MEHEQTNKHHGMDQEGKMDRGEGTHFRTRHNMQVKKVGPSHDTEMGA